MTPALRDDWRAEAKCFGVDTSTFYAHTDKLTLGENRMIADRVKKRYCDTCTVKDDCLEFALATNERDGIWGGMTEKERQSERRARARARKKQSENEKNALI